MLYDHLELEITITVLSKWVKSIPYNGIFGRGH